MDDSFVEHNTQSIYVSVAVILTLLFYVWTYLNRHTVPPESQRAACILLICSQIIGYSVYVYFYADPNQYVWYAELGLICLLCVSMAYSYTHERRGPLYDEYEEVI